MKQNKYDEPAFFAAYSGMERSQGGLAAANEWPAFRALLPPLAGKRVLDLGCGFGWHCRYAREQGAASVVGVDLSEKMLARAGADTHDPAISYRRGAIEEVAFADGSFDVAISSLALHYVENLDRVFRNVHRWLVPGGAFVFSMEHPIFTAREEQDWARGEDGKPRYWPVDRYADEGARNTHWMTGDVVKYHHTFATIIDTLLDAGFHLARVAEPVPSPAAIARRPDLADEGRRPMFLIVGADR